MNYLIYDIIIIGAGPNGLSVAIEAINKNLKVLVIEKGTIAESIRKYPLQMTFFSTAENIAIGDIPFTIDKPKATREEALNYYRNVVAYYDIPIRLFCFATSIEKRDGKFVIENSGNEKLIARNVVLATGYFDFPRKLSIPGESMSHVKYYYDEPYPYTRRKVVIIGAGNSAIEAALSLYRHGAEVTLVVRGKEMKKTAKYWLIPDLQNRIKEGKIRAYFNCQATRIEEKYVIAMNLDSGIEIPIQSDHVFILAGYLPDIGLFRTCGIDYDIETLEPSFNEETYETNIKNLYVAGTATAGINTEKVFIENGRLHGEKIINDILMKNSKNP